MAQTIRLTIDAIAAGGDGVGRADGLVVFVPRTAPGDTVTASITGKKRFARGVVRSIDVPSPDRIDPPCEHYTRDRCGGCQLQHLTYKSQLTAKQGIIVDAIQRIGKRDAGSPVVKPSEPQWRYRTKLTLALRQRGQVPLLVPPPHRMQSSRPPAYSQPAGANTSTTASLLNGAHLPAFNGINHSDAPWVAGLHAYDSPSRVFALYDCPITDSRVVETWREIMQASRFLPTGTPELRGSVRWTDDGPTFVLMGSQRWPTAEKFFSAVSSLAALYWEPSTPEPYSNRLSTASSKRATSPSVSDTSPSRLLIADRRLHITPAASFAQVNPMVAQSLRDYVEARILSYTPTTVVDGYAGNGDLAIRLSRQGVTVRAIELDIDAAAWSAQHLSPPSKSLQGRVEDLLSAQLPSDVVVLNPPRAGLHESIPATLENGSPPRALFYISCDPATLARDLSRLSSYRINSLLAFDMFPQTSHVETVCELVPLSDRVTTSGTFA